MTQNPVTLQFDQVSGASTWTIDIAEHLPFGGKAREVESVVAEGPILDASSLPVFAMPYATTEAGSGQDQVLLTWPEPVRGRIHVTVRADKPV